LTSLLVVVLLARLALGPALAAVAAAGSTATVATVMGAARLALLFGHDDPFAWMSAALFRFHEATKLSEVVADLRSRERSGFDALGAVTAWDE
jgi:hypothetical protein